MTSRLLRRGLAAAALLAAGEAAAEGPPRVHAIEGARIVVAPGRLVESGTVVMRDGILTAVGSEASAPADARLWDGRGLTVYPGLIDAYSPRAPQAAGEDAGPLVTPERDATALASDAALNKKLRDAGFTTALVAPKAGVLRGKAALVNLGEGELRENLLRREVALTAAFDTAAGEGGVYPASLMGAVALFRQAMLDASWYATAHAAFGRDPGQQRPPVEASLEALQPAVTGALPVLFETRNALDGLRAARVLRELGLSAWLVGRGDEYRWLDELRATGLPWILSLDFPADPTPGEEDDLSLGLEDLRHWDRAPDNPRALLEAGLTVAFTSFRLADPGKLHANLAKAIARGLEPQAALAALTTTPASLLGIADRAGTLEPGKMANLVVVEGELFVDRPRIREVWIDGRRYEVEKTKPPEVDAESPQGPARLTATRTAKPEPSP